MQKEICDPFDCFNCQKPFRGESRIVLRNADQCIISVFLQLKSVNLRGSLACLESLGNNTSSMKSSYNIPSE